MRVSRVTPKRHQVGAEFAAEPVEKWERESDHVADAAVDPIGEQSRRTLEGVSAGLVGALPGAEVPAGPSVVDRADMHERRLGRGGDPIRRVTDGDAGQHLVGPSGQQREHPPTVVAISRLAEDVAIHDHRGVGRDHDGTVASGSGRLGQRQPRDVLGRGFARILRLVDFGNDDVEFEPQPRQEFAAAGGARGKYQPGRCHPSSVPAVGSATTFRGRPSTLRPIEDFDDLDIESTEGMDLSARSGFFRAGPPVTDLRGVVDGPRWTREDADAEAHRFLDELAAGRTVRRYEDPLEHARENALLLLFGAPELAAFETLLARMPRERAAEWRELLSGGASSEAFGPLTLQERLDERQVEATLVQGRRQRNVNLVLGGLTIIAVILAGVVAYRAVTESDERTEGALRFDPVVEEEADQVVAGDAPVAAPELTASLTSLVAVQRGDGAAEDRIVTVPFSAVPQPPGALRASVFDYGGAGQVAVVGPAGWLLDPVCLRASVVSTDLRALDTVTWESAAGACVEPVGRRADPVCVGDSAVLLDVQIPSGEVPLPEGGVAFADAIRVQLVAPPTDEYEVLTVRGLIVVSADSDVTIPRFGGVPGDEITFDLGADRSGSCTIGASGG